MLSALRWAWRVLRPASTPPEEQFQIRKWPEEPDTDALCDAAELARLLSDWRAKFQAFHYPMGYKGYCRSAYAEAHVDFLAEEFLVRWMQMAERGQWTELNRLLIVAADRINWLTVTFDGFQKKGA